MKQLNALWRRLLHHDEPAPVYFGEPNPCCGYHGYNIGVPQIYTETFGQPQGETSGRSLVIQLVECPRCGYRESVQAELLMSTKLGEEQGRAAMAVWDAEKLLREVKP